MKRRKFTDKETTSALFHELAGDKAIAVLKTDAQRGLTTKEGRSRFEQYGPNELRQQKARPAWRRFLQQFQDALVILLLVAAAVSSIVWFLEREAALPYESTVILAIVILNAVLGFIQEERAEKALLALRAMSAPEATVIRESQQSKIPARELVPGDLLLIAEGDAVPADARLIDVVELKTLEASLTGESLPVGKGIDPVSGDASLGDRNNMIFAGTAVAYGHARAVVTATGMHTELGRIAGLLERAKTETTPLQRELDRTGKRIGVSVVVIAVVVVATMLILEGAHDPRTVLDALLFGVALAVAAVPEGLAAIVTVVLAIGVQRMAKRGAIVRKLPAVETLGAATVIATDKTGTLTRNEMTVRALVTSSGRVDIGGTGYSPEGELRSESGPVAGSHRSEVELLLRGAVLSSNAKLIDKGEVWSIHGDPTEGALIVAAEKARVERANLEQHSRRVRELPFSSERKMMSTVCEDGSQSGRYRLWAKGAPDVLLERCTTEFVKGETQVLTDERRAAIRETNASLTKDALRTMAVAYRDLPQDLNRLGCEHEILESELVFVGLAGMIDPPRSEVAGAVERAKNAGVRTIMITGDHPGTAVAIARELGIGSGERAFTGRELERMTPEELASAVAGTSVYARVDPRHKMRIVDALQASGDVVAMTGDGVNDAPALKSADIGVAMGITGTEVSKEAADIVLTDDNFATIVVAVEQGRAVFANIRKFLYYLLSSNAGEVLTIFLGVVFAGPLGLVDQDGLILPLLATQVLWINLMTDGPPALALGVDPAEKSVMAIPPRPPGEHVIATQMWITVGVVGMVMATGTLLVLDASMPGGLLQGSQGIRHGRTMAFTTLVLFQLFNAFNSRSNRESALVGLLGNRWLVGAVLLSLVLHAIVLRVSFLQNAFQVQPLSLQDWFACLLVVSSVLWVMEIWKFWLRRS